MSNIFNELLLERFFEEFLEEGFSDWEADKLAHEKLEQTPNPCGQVKLREVYWSFDCTQETRIRIKGIKFYPNH